MLRQLTREPVLAAGISLAIVPPALLHFLSSEKVAWGGIAHALFVGASAGASHDRGDRAHGRRSPPQRRAQRDDRLRVRRHGGAARAARDRDARRALRRLRRGRVLRRRDDPRRRRAARALHAADPQAPARRQAAARDAGRAPRGGRGARLRRPRVPEHRPGGPGAALHARVDRARGRPRLLRAHRLARVSHVPAHQARGRPARRRGHRLARVRARGVAPPHVPRPRLVARPRARGARDRGDRRPGRARPPTCGRRRGRSSATSAPASSSTRRKRSSAARSAR